MKAIRNYALLALLLMAGMTMQAQQWELDFGDQNDINQYSRIDAGVMDADGNAVLIGRFGRRHDWNTQLFKVHPDGNYEHRICEDLPKMLLTHDIVQLDNGNYFTVAQLQPDSTLINYGGSELWAIVFDDRLEIVESKVCTHNSPELKSWPSLLNDNGQVVACGYYYESSNRVFPYMYRFDQNADTLACRYVVPEYYNANDPEFRLQGFMCHNIFKNPSGNGYIFLCNGPGGGIGTAFYDEDFQYVKAYRYILGTPGAADMDGFALGDRGYSDYFLSNDRLLFFGARCPWKQGIDEHLLTIGDLDLTWTVGPGQHGYNVDCGRVNHYEVGFLHNGRRNEEPSGHGSRCMATVNDTTMYGCYMTWYDLGGDLQTGLCLFDRDMEILGGLPDRDPNAGQFTLEGSDKAYLYFYKLDNEFNMIDSIEYLIPLDTTNNAAFYQAGTWQFPNISMAKIKLTSSFVEDGCIVGSYTKTQTRYNNYALDSLFFFKMDFDGNFLVHKGISLGDRGSDPYAFNDQMIEKLNRDFGLEREVYYPYQERTNLNCNSYVVCRDGGVLLLSYCHELDNTNVNHYIVSR